MSVRTSGTLLTHADFDVGLYLRSVKCADGATSQLSTSTELWGIQAWNREALRCWEPEQLLKETIFHQQMNNFLHQKTHKNTRNQKLSNRLVLLSSKKETRQISLIPDHQDSAGQHEKQQTEEELKVF